MSAERNPIVVSTAPQHIALLGATGSIGSSTLKLLRLHPDRWKLCAISGFSNAQALLDIAQEFRPRWAWIAERHFSASWAQRFAEFETELLSRDDELNGLASAREVDIVVAAIVGAAGLPSTLAAAQAGKRILLANKESLVCGGEWVVAAALQSGAALLPVDSEHNALFQCLPKRAENPDWVDLSTQSGVEKLWLTASGGPFRRFSATDLERVTPEQACQHPNWAMGRKISVDSATLMNKGLEVIEARVLFGAEAAQMQVVVHPQSIVHSLVEYADGSFLAQLSSPDMCTPIANALAYPQRVASGAKRLDLLQLSQLQFEAPDLQRFPCLELAYQAMRAGPAAQVVLNAANEIAVECFLNKQIAFTGIPQLINDCLQDSRLHSLRHVQDVFELDQRTRASALQISKKSYKNKGLIE